MPLTSVPSRGSGHPKLLGVFPRLTPIVVNVIGPNTLFVSETAQQMLSQNDAGDIDALSVGQTDGILTLWMIGEVWIAGSQVPGATFKPFIYVPGVVTSGGTIITGDGGYGTSPSKAPALNGLYGDL